jgi:hypothetical protein
MGRKPSTTDTGASTKSEKSTPEPENDGNFAGNGRQPVGAAVDTLLTGRERVKNRAVQGFEQIADDFVGSVDATSSESNWEVLDL